jgi:hypothetical protein
MSRTTRKIHRAVWYLDDDPWDEWYRTRITRGLYLQGSVSPPKRSGGYLCDWCHSPNGKKYYKRLQVKMRRREAKAKLRRR